MIRLMKNTFYNEEETKKLLCEFIMQADRLSMYNKCIEFEEKFSKHQGRKYSVLFNSGSSANLALIQGLLHLGILKKGDNVGFSALTWGTNVMPLIQLGLNPIPIDISLKNLNVNSENLLEVLKEEKLKVLFITNLLGFCGDLNKIKEICDKEGIILLEDNCESLGSEFDGTKLGNFGLASTCSFFVGHHLSTIEGGMVCTDSKELCEELLMIRAHGWSRDSSEEIKSKLKNKHNIEDFHEAYTFYRAGYNLRPTEITGFIGVEQLKYIEKICQKRQDNFNKYHECANNNPDFIELDFSNMDFTSNFAYPIICRNKGILNEYVKKFFDVEIRPIVGGSITKQPFFKENKYSCPNAEIVHEQGFYIPNNPDLTEDEIRYLLKLMEKNPQDKNDTSN